MDRTLSASPLSGAEFSRADSGDDADIRALLREVPMAGALKIGFSREPSYFACPAPAGLEEHTLVARRGGRLLGAGSWSTRQVWLRGSMGTIGYLHGLRLAPGTPGAMRVLRHGYRELTEWVKGAGASGWFTSVDASNRRARHVLESRVGGLPEYTRLADYLTRVLPVPRQGAVRGVDRSASPEELSDFLNYEGRRHELALTWNADRWDALARRGFTERDCCVVRRRGRIVAAAGVWDQSGWKQVVVHGYSPWLRRLRPWIGAGAACLGWPGMPREGGRLAQAPVFPFAVAAGAAGTLPELWSGLESLARQRGIDWLVLGLDAEDPLWKTRRTPRIGLSYRTILYSVEGHGFPRGWAGSFSGCFRPECATL